MHGHLNVKLSPGILTVCGEPIYYHRSDLWMDLEETALLANHLPLVLLLYRSVSAQYSSSLSLSEVRDLHFSFTLYFVSVCKK